MVDKSAKLTRDDLIAATAEFVMGWFNASANNGKPLQYPFFLRPTSSNGSSFTVCEKDRLGRGWNPLASMSDCWEVVKKLEADEWDLSLSRFNGQYVAGFCNGDDETEENSPSEYEAILKSALATLEFQQ